VRILRKLLAFVALVIAAAVFGAGYGALHDQLSYTVAPEYFTRFKFIQFAWAGVADMAPRVGAAIVGALATWWVGLYAGILVAGAGLLHRTAHEMVESTFRAYALLVLVAVCAGLIGLAVGWLGFGANEAAAYVDWWRPDGLISPKRFFAVGMMHDASYLGGAVGALVAVGYQRHAAHRRRDASSPSVAALSSHAA
jgi:hypothetical protein